MTKAEVSYGAVFVWMSQLRSGRYGSLVNAAADSPKVPRGCAWAIVAVGVLLLAMGVISFVAMPILWKRSQEAWPETQGTLVESYVKQGVRRDSGGSGINSRSGSTTYDVRLKYRYTVDGKELHGDAKALRQPEEDENWPQAKAIWESYKAGDALAVYYRPSDPARSRFTAKEPGIELKKDVFFLIAYLLGGWGMFVWGRKLLRMSA